MLPQARQDGLSVRAMPEETLIYDLQRNKAHCLNRTAALVWQHCDGQTTLAGLAQIVREQLHAPADEGLVRLALEQLRRRDLLIADGTPTAHSRRDVLKRLSVAAALLPLVMTLTAPKAAAQVSAACRGRCIRDSDCATANPAPARCRCQVSLCVPAFAP